MVIKSVLGNQAACLFEVPVLDAGCQVGPFLGIDRHRDETTLASDDLAQDSKLQHLRDIEHYR